VVLIAAGALVCKFALGVVIPQASARVKQAADFGCSIGLPFASGGWWGGLQDIALMRGYHLGSARILWRCALPCLYNALLMCNQLSYCHLPSEGLIILHPCEAVLVLIILDDRALICQEFRDHSWILR
jgi:hypothetical protein